MSVNSCLKFLTICALGTFTLYGTATVAQTKPAAEKQYEQLIFSVRGPDLFRAHCAACHGPEGKGNGPAGAALKTKPADLTILAKNNGGKFPALKVTSDIRGESDLPAHGSKEMPVLGGLFWSMSRGHEGEVQQRVANLTHYVESLQAK